MEVNCKTRTHINLTCTKPDIYTFYLNKFIDILETRDNL